MGNSQAAQTHHYVPKFILRNFLEQNAAKKGKERVSVFSKLQRRGFVTSIDNIMAERRFHDFAIGSDHMASFEQAITQVEGELLPTYRRVIEQRRLTHSPDEKAVLAIFVAFQLLRTRSQRDQFVRMETLLKEKLERTGHKLEDLEGYEPLDEDSLTFQHIGFIRKALAEFSQTVASKDFVLFQPPPGRGFYLGDNPVALHNQKPAHPIFGNIGLSVEGIEIYLPLSANLMLGAFCPTIMPSFSNTFDEQMEMARRTAVSALMDGFAPSVGKAHISHISDTLEPLRSLLDAWQSGDAYELTSSTMDFNNSLQLAFAKDFVICARNDFELARRFLTMPVTERQFA